MIDVRILDPEAINIEIAKELGWTVTYRVIGWNDCYFTVDPSGKERTSAMRTEQAAWNFSERNHFEWTKDANIALSLVPKDRTAKFHLEWLMMDQVWFVTMFTPSGRRIEEYADTPALAICRAWLVWRFLLATGEPS